MKKYDILMVYFLVIPDVKEDFYHKQWKLTLEMLEVSCLFYFLLVHFRNITFHIGT